MYQKIVAFLKCLFSFSQKQEAAKLPLYYEIARKEIGVKEISGKSHNPRIIEYHTATALKATEDEVSWCSAFANWCLLKAGVKGTNNAAARSFLKWGKSVKEDPKEGDICIFWRGSPESWQGHVGFYVREDLINIYVLGGNQNNSVCVQAYPKSRLLDIRRGA